ncbi:MAG: ABC transporter ATP-binding protein [Bergeyella sp.]|nr:ABC transporter ATP-binding protein [Bergeyella sp.]
MIDHTSTKGFFFYIKDFIGCRIYVYMLLNFLIGVFDCLGLALFIPLISVATGNIESTESLGKLGILITLLENWGIKLTLFSTLLVMMMMFTIKGGFYYIKQNYLNNTTLLVQKKIRTKLVEGLRNTSYEGFTKLEAGNLQNNMVTEAGKLDYAMNSYFITVQHFVMLITYVMMALVSNWKFSILVSMGAFMTNFLYKYLNKIIKIYAQRLTLLGHDFSGNLIQMIQNFKYLKATNNIKVFEKKLKDDIETTRQISYKIGRINSIAESLKEPLIIGVMIIVIYIQVQVFDNNFNTILVSLLLFYRALGYLMSMQTSWSSFLKASVGVNSVEDLLKKLNAYKEREKTKKIASIGNIAIKNVGFYYTGKKVLKNVSLDIPKNSSIALVGESGAGKTTLANAICGLIKPHEGEIFSENTAVYESNIEEYRKKTGYITQEAVIFDDTIFNNVSLWAEKSKENLDKFYNVIQMVSLEKMLESIPEKEDTPLGNNGILVSGGQKQRISIARELYRDTELLIMDEATSALDSQTEKYIKENIDLLQGKCTIVIIAHRLSTIKDVDMIYLLEKGSITARGNYSELIKNSEKFTKMVELQKLT